MSAGHRKHIVITRPPTDDSEIRHQLESAGFRLSEVPLIETRAVPFTLEKGSWDWLFFTSRNGVNSFYAQSPAITGQPGIAAVGPATAQALARNGHPADFIPSEFNAEAAAGDFAQEHGKPGLKVLWPCGNLAHPQLANLLNANGMQVTPVVVYETSLRGELSKSERQLLEQEADLIAFTSPSAVMAYHRLTSPPPRHSRPAIACLGPRTAQAALKYLKHVDVQAEPHTLAGLADSLLAYYGGVTHES